MYWDADFSVIFCWLNLRTGVAEMAGSDVDILVWYVRAASPLRV